MGNFNLASRTRTHLVWIMMILGTSSLFYGLYMNQKGESAKQWLSTVGVIEKSQVKDVAGARSGRVDYQVVVRYRYHLQGADYRGSRIYFDSSNRFDDPVAAYEFLNAHYPVGRYVDVFYDQGQPAVSILRPEGVANGNVAITFGIVFFVFALNSLLLIIREKRLGSIAAASA